MCLSVFRLAAGAFFLTGIIQEGKVNRLNSYVFCFVALEISLVRHFQNGFDKKERNSETLTKQFNTLTDVATSGLLDSSISYLWI